MQESTEKHWIALYVNGDNVTYFDSFGVENNLKEIKIFIGKKDITTNIYITQSCNSIICRDFCNGFIDFLLKSESFLGST